MRSRDLIDGFDYGEYMQRQMFCFGSSDPGGGGGGGLSDEDIDQDLQQDIAAASAGLSRDDYSYGAGFDPGGRDEQVAAKAVRDIVEASTVGSTAAERSANAQAMQNELARQASVNQAVGNLVGRPVGYQQQEIASLEQLNRDLMDLSRREQRMKDMMPYSPITGYIGLQNVRNLAAAAAGYPPGLLSGIGITDRQIGSGLDPSALAGLQSRAIRGATGKDPFGRDTTGIVGFRDEYGNVAYGVDPNAPDASGGDDGTQTVKPVNPVTGQCDAGYIFDEDLQACRLDTRGGAGAGGGVGSVVPPTPGGYARMGLLDVAPTGLPQFQQQYGAGFGTPADFTAANLNFRRQGATYPQYFQRPPQLSGYTLLS